MPAHKIPSKVWNKRMANMVRLIAQAAKEGKPCPSVYDFRQSGLVGDALVCQKKLVEEGIVRFEIYASYYRVAEILKGTYAGLSTRAPHKPEHGHAAIKVLDSTEPKNVKR